MKLIKIRELIKVEENLLFYNRDVYQYYNKLRMIIYVFILMNQYLSELG